MCSTGIGAQTTTSVMRWPCSPSAWRCFPLRRASRSPTAVQTLVGYVHLACATLFFLGMAYFSLFLFTRTDLGLILTAKKRQRDAVDRVCGIVIVACLVLVVVTNSVFTNHVRDQVHPVFWLEPIAVWAFSVSWLVKGEFLFLRDWPAGRGPLT